MKKILVFYMELLDDDESKSKFEKIYMDYRQDMYAIAFNILKNHEDSEDAVHDAFIAIAKNFKKIDCIPPRELKYYLIIVIKNISITLYNKNKKKGLKYEEAYSDKHDLSDNKFLEHYNYIQLVDNISKLPPMYKDIIFLWQHRIIDKQKSTHTKKSV